MTAVAYALSPDPRLGRWSPEEDAILRANYQLGSRVVAQMTGRTIDSIQKRAGLVGVVAQRRWTAADDDRLQMLWGEMALDEIAAQLGRTKIACADRMTHVLGLSRKIRNASELSVHAKRTGFHKNTLRKILASGRVRPLPDVSIRSPGARFRRFAYDPDQVDRAVEKWLSTEAVGQAAASRGMSPESLRRRLKRSGLRLPTRPRGKGSHWRVPTETIDKAVAMVGGGWDMRRKFPARARRRAPSPVAAQGEHRCP